MVSDHGSTNKMVRRDLERLRYWQGQKLRSNDFNDLAQTEDQLRWWHNRSLHDIPGVLEGLNVQIDGTTVVIQPGLAYDGFGRELIHAREKRIPIPDPLPDQGLILLACLRSNLQMQTAASRACLPSALRQLDFTWLPADEIGGRHRGVRLGRIFRGSDGTLLSESEHRFTRPLARPRIASGWTIPGATNWVPWEAGLKRELLGFQVDVDTSASGFIDTPCYFAWLQAVDWLGTVDEEISVLEIVTVDHIDDVSAHGFTFRFRPLSSRGQTRGGPFDFFQKKKPYVFWMGIEPS
jgi:hypothetical protein